MTTKSRRSTRSIACTCSGHGSVDALCELLRRDFETTVVPGRFFEMPDRFRIGVGITTESVRDALRQLGMGLERYRSQARTRQHA